MGLKTLKRKKGRFVGIPYPIANSDLFAKLSAPENKLILDLLLQYNGNNNGMLSPCHTLMKKRGWAKSSLRRAFNKLQHAGFLVVTRQGWKRRGKPTLVAITWEGIDEPLNGVIFDEGIVPHHSPLGYWCTAKKSWKHKPKVKEMHRSISPNMEDKSMSYSPKLELVAS
jgi:hypothetical protein